MNLLSAPLEQLLVSGGDRRLAIDPCTGLNSFGCSPSPYPESVDVYSFGSCTATTISEESFCAVEGERARLVQLLSVAEQSAWNPGDQGWGGLTRLFELETERLRSALLQLLGLDEMAVDLVFSPSGTDSVLQALVLTRILSGGRPVDCLLVASDETGSGVGHALAGRHFNSVTSTGISVVQGDPVCGLSENVRLISFPVSTVCLEVRSEDVYLPESDGRHPLCAREQELLAALERSVDAGSHVLLQVMEVSKLGRSFPSDSCLRAIRTRFADAVTIVVDACQMRSGRERLRRHLAQGHMVLISGSKFFAGPPFSGALLVPAFVAARINAVRVDPLARLLEGLQDYTGRSDWPEDWCALRAALPVRINVGQHFRWIAALEEMRSYFSIPVGFRSVALYGFASTVRKAIRRRDALRLLTGSTDEIRDEIKDEIKDLITVQITDEPMDTIPMGSRSILPFLVRLDRHRPQQDIKNKDIKNKDIKNKDIENKDIENKDIENKDGETGWASYDEARAIYHALNRDVRGLLPARSTATERAVAARRCSIGQPVAIGLHSGERVGALRICASARTVSRLWANHANEPARLSLARESEAIEAILDKIELLARLFHN